MATTQTSDASTEAENNSGIQAAIEAVDEAVEAVGQISAEDAEDADAEEVAELVTGLKALEDSTEDARKDEAEEVLDAHAEPGESVGDLTRVKRHNKFLEGDEQTALNLLREAGGNPEDALVFDLQAFIDAAEDTPLEVEELVGRYTYTYYTR